MNKTMIAAAAMLAASAAALYVAMPALALSEVQSGTQSGVESDPDPMGEGTVTWVQAKAKADAMWPRLDVNKDGVLSEADREAKLMQAFDEFDTNHDSSVSRDEFVAHHKAMMDSKHGPMAGLPTGMGHGGRMMRAMEAMADTNHDGQISRAEFDAAAKARFDKADTNHDGKLTRAERHAAWGAIHTRHGKHSGMGHGGMEHGGKMGDDMGDMPPPPPLGE